MNDLLPEVGVLLEDLLFLVGQGLLLCGLTAEKRFLVALVCVCWRDCVGDVARFLAYISSNPDSCVLLVSSV